LVLVLGLLAAGLAPMPAQAAPSGFNLQAMPVSGLVQPTGVEFAPSGKVIVSERRGVIKVSTRLTRTARETLSVPHVGMPAKGPVRRRV
jgi:hypothetical protein